MGDLTDYLTCSICREIYTAPVTLACGHNFCQDCITNTWKSREDMGEDYACPECCRSVMRRPQLTSNVTLKRIVDRVCFKQRESGIFCTYCKPAHEPASKTCLLCQTSLCVTHLYWHSKSEMHVLTEPKADFENKKCSIHGKDLHYYCKKDGSCICESCHSDGEHRGHQVENLDVASEKKKMILKHVLRNLTPERTEIEESEQILQEHSREVEIKSEHQTKQINLIFRNIREQHKALENQVYHDISWLQDQLSLPLIEQMKQLGIKKKELIIKIDQVKEICNMVNPVAVLQEGAALFYSEEGDNEDSRSKQAPNLEQLDQVSETLLTGLNRIATEISTFINKQKAPTIDRKKNGDDLALTEGAQMPCCSGKPQQHIPACTEKAEELAVFRTVSCFEASCCVVPPMYIKKATDITLDIKTAANNVVVSDDNKTMFYSKTSQCYPECPDRFQESQVLSSRVFASGKHYWEVEVSELGELRIGVAYPSIARKGFQSYIGENTKSWCLYRYETYKKLDEKQQKCSGRHGSKEINLPYKVSCHRLGVYLDCEAGSVSFYELCNPIRHLHTFITTFTEPLHAAFCVWGDASVKILS